MNEKKNPLRDIKYFKQIYKKMKNKEHHPKKGQSIKSDHWCAWWCVISYYGLSKGLVT